MTLGTPPVKVRAEMFYSGVWNDVTSYVYNRDTIGISRGTQSEGTTADPSQITATLQNTDYRFSARNPTSPLYGLIGRNTPFRVRAGLTLSDNYGLGLANESPVGYASTPDAAALDIVGDIDIAVEFTAMTVTSGTQCLVSKGTSNGVTGTQLSYQVLLGVSAGVPHVTLRWSTDGTTVKFVDHPMAALTPYTHMAIRVTLQVNNGAGGNTASFYTSSNGTVGGTWNLDGSTTVTAGVTSIFSGTGICTVGAQATPADGFRGLIFAAFIKNGIAGTAVANPNFAAQAVRAASFADPAGRTWTMTNDSYIDYYLHTRMIAEISDTRQRRDISGTDIYAQISASGVSRRLQQGENAPNADVLAAYLQGSNTIRSWTGQNPNDQFNRAQLAAVGATVITYGDGDLGFGTKVITLNGDPPPRDANGYLLSDYLNGDVLTAAGGQIACAYTFQAGQGQLGDISVVVNNGYDGVIGTREWEVQVRGDTGQVLLLQRQQNYTTGVVTLSTLLTVSVPAVAGPTGSGNGDGLKHDVFLFLQTSGGNITWNLYFDGTSIGSGTISTATLSAFSQFHVAYAAVNGGAAQFGYVGCWVGSSALAVSAATYHQISQGYLAETAADRITRLCTGDGITISINGVAASTMPMGPQGSQKLFELLTECATSDGGYLADLRAGLGLAYIPRSALYKQTPTVTLDYATHVFSDDPQPTDDDLNIHNDITATNYTGTSVEQTLTAGALSTLAPPNGINPYPGSVSVNVASDGFLPDIARWALNQQTVDKPRWPQLPLSMLNTAVRTNTALYNAIADAGLTSLVQITNPVLPLPPDPINVLLFGDQETIAQDQWDLKWNCVPADVYQAAGVYASAAGSTNAKYDAENSTVGTLFNTVATSLSIVSAANTQPWTTNAAEFPFDIGIGGERMTVTNITGASSPQTFTVTRSVNSIVKSHAVGEAVHLWSPTRYAL